VKADVGDAVDELRAAFPDSSVTVIEDHQGGAYVVVDPVDIGSSFEPNHTWIGFHITWPYPDADVYPLFIDSNVRYVGSRPVPNQHPQGALPVPMTRGAAMPGFPDKAAIQVSRRSNRRNRETDSATRKVLRVLEFLRGL
jgi:hypothetical protein